jgi:hypothetical protein
MSIIEKHLGILNRTAIKRINRPVYYIDPGEEFVIKSGNRSFIIRGTGGRYGTGGGLQLFSRDYASGSNPDEIFSGTINGIVIGLSFSVGYEKDIVVKDIKTIRV